MQKDFANDMSKASKKAMDTAREATDLNNSTLQTVLSKQLELVNQFASINARQMQILTEYKDVPSALQAQTALVQEITEQAAGNAREAVELVNKTRTAYEKLVQKGVKETTDAVNKAQASFSATA